jgi:hypothetical protein
MPNAVTIICVTPDHAAYGDLQDWVVCTEEGCNAPDEVAVETYPLKAPAARFVIHLPLRDWVAMKRSFQVLVSKGVIQLQSVTMQ